MVKEFYIMSLPHMPFIIKKRCEATQFLIIKKKQDLTSKRFIENMHFMVSFIECHCVQRP